MHTSKKTKLPKPIKVKKEKTEEERTLQPMSHYIDDRLELVKQIFGTLKPKTITNLAPDFLKKKSLDEIEELCLNELLCISTKRLLSIINATKCPTDTESSGDSDVQHEEEHISLEEISSDSEIEGSSSTNAKKKSGTSRTKAKKDAKKSAEKQENDGPISVLELLELQARARAIRSQLALEPVTKIEVDSDDEKDSNKNGKSSKDHKVHKEHKNSRKERKRKSIEKESSSDKFGKSSASTTIVTVRNTNTNGPIETAAASTTSDHETEKRSNKKVKLKRNYRINNTEQAKIGSGDIERIVSMEKTTVPEMKQEGRSRTQSPDVIPIVPEPETLLISDSSDMEVGETVNNVKKAADTLNTKVGAIATDSERESTSAILRESTTKNESETEAEEGEISDSEIDDTQKKNGTNVKEVASQENQATLKPIESEQKSADMPAEISESKNSEIQLEPDISEKSCSTVKSPPAVIAASPTSNTAELITSTIEKLSHEETIMENQFQEEDDQIDDVISLEGGDLESEMIEHLEENPKSENLFDKAKGSSELKEPEDADVISLDSSGDERNQQSSESWHSRYLKSSKVSKVLATSRLGKRVRDKIKKSKRSKKISEKDVDSADLATTSKETFISKHEDGSIEQYKELLELRQRKI